jgi:hypothetical protein
LADRRQRAPTADRDTLTPVRFLRKHPRLRPLDERECYLRLHGRRSGEVEIVPALEPAPAAERVDADFPQLLAEPPLGPRGPTDVAPALHLLIAYPRSGGRLTGEQLRRELLRRMEARAGEAA